MTQQEIVAAAAKLKKPDKITSYWMNGDPKTRVLFTLYPAKLKDWEEYNSSVDYLAEMADKARNEGLIGPRQKLGMIQIPDEADMPKGNPAEPLKRAFEIADKAGFGMINMVVNNKFANLVNNNIVLPVLKFNISTQVKSVSDIETAAANISEYLKSN